jgi:sec-independent protein translocase protein TatC
MKDRVQAVLSEVDAARRGLGAYLVLVLVLAMACFHYSEPGLRVLIRLLGRMPVAYDPAEPFLTLASLSFYGAFVLSLPVGAWLLWRGVAGRFFPAWRGKAGIVVLVATALFLSGATLCWRVLLPAGIGFLVGFENGNVTALISARTFVSFCGTMIVALGLAFEMPLVAYFLARAGWLTPAFFKKRWRHAVLVCTVLAAVITPTPDVYNMTLMAIPLLALYFVSFGVVAFVSVRAGARQGPGPRSSGGPPPPGGPGS